MLLVVGVVATIHAPMLSARALALDDAAFLTENPLVQNPSWQSAQRFISEVLEPSTVGGYYLPLTMIALMLDYGMGGRPDDLRVFHITSLLLHLVNVCLIIVLLFLLFGDVWGACALGLLFGAHPLTVEPVIWVGEKKTLLATLFALASMVAYVRYVQRPRRLFMALAVVGYALSLLSKPTATMLPLLLLLLDVWPLRRWGRRVWIEKIPFAVLGAISVAITLVSHERTAGLALPDNPSVLQTLLLASRNLFFYLQKIVWPTDLAAYYHIPEPLSLAQPQVLFGVVGTVVVALALALSLRWSRGPLIAFAFFVLALLPTLGFVRYSWVLVSDKYVYFPLIGLLLLLASLIAWAQHRGGSARGARGARGERTAHGARATRVTGAPRATRVALVVIVCGLTILEARGVRAAQKKWADSDTLFRHMVDVAPEAPRAHDMYGKLLLQEERIPHAMQQFRQSIAIDSLYAPGYVEIANVQFKQGDLEQAMQNWQTALDVDPDFAEAHTGIAVGLARRGRTQEAMAHLQQALDADPGNPYALNNLGIQLFRLGRMAEAEDHFVRALRSKTNYADAWVNLGVVHARSGRASDALHDYDAALAHGADPDLVAARQAESYVQLKQFGEAARVYRDLVSRHPDDARLHNNFAMVLIRSGDLQAARQQAEAALSLQADYTDARLNLAFIFEKQGNLQEALRQYRAILQAHPEHAVARERMQQVKDKARVSP
jgi:Tfp pilus assembly protein PilF